MKKTEDSSFSLPSHFLSTCRSPYSTYYIPFQSPGSQESNASNGVRFGVEMKELQPLEADHSKLKANFAGLRNQPLAAKSQEDGCEISLLLREFRSHFEQCTGVLLKLPDSCDRHFWIFFFRYFCINFHSSPCNPPIIGFLSL